MKEKGKKRIKKKLKRITRYLLLPPSRIRNEKLSFLRTNLEYVTVQHFSLFPFCHFSLSLCQENSITLNDDRETTLILSTISRYRSSYPREGGSSRYGRATLRYSSTTTQRLDRFGTRLCHFGRLVQERHDTHLQVSATGSISRVPST